MACNSTCVPAGDRGLTGAQGEYGGFASNWLFSTSTASGTSVTELRFDNSTLSSVTGIYVNDTNADSTDLSAFLASLSNSGDFGRIRVFKESDSNVFAMFTLTAVTDSGSEYDLTVTHIDSNGTFAATDSVVLEFTPAGPTGSTASSYTYFTGGPLDYTWTTGESTITGASHTIATTGTYQVFINHTADCDFAGTGAQASSLRLYVGGVLQDTIPLSSGDASSPAVTGEMRHSTFIWRGNITATDTVELRGFEGSSDTIVTVQFSMLINEET